MAVMSAGNENADVRAPNRETQQPSLRRQVSWTLPANLIYGLCNLLLIVILNRFGPTAEAGLYGLALGITAPLFMFANLRFSTILATDVKNKATLRDYFSLRGVLLGSALVLAVPLACLYPKVTVLVCILALSKAIEAISELCCGVQQRIGRIDRIAISLIANGVLLASTFFIAYYTTRSLAVACAAICVARLIVLLSYDVPKARAASLHAAFSLDETANRELSDAQANETDDKTERDRARRSLLAIGLPLGITAALISLTSNIPRYTIPSILNDDMLGIFVSLAVVLQAGNLVFRAVEIPTIPRLAKFIDARDRAGFWTLLARAVGLFAVVGFAGAIVGWNFGAQILVAAFDEPAYAGYQGLLVLMIFCTTFSQLAGMIESSLIASRITAVQIPMHCLTAISCLALCLWLVPVQQLYGAAIAVTLCRVPFVVLGLLLIHRKLASAKDASNLAEERISSRLAASSDKTHPAQQQKAA